MSRHRKQWLLLLLSAYLQSLAGCLPMTGIQSSLDKQQRVLNLVDQGTLKLRDRQFEEAQGAFSAAYEIMPNAASLDGLGCVAFAMGDLRKAEKFFIQSRKQDPQYYNSIANLALLYESTGNSSLSLELYQQAISIQPDNYRARNNFAAWLLAQKRVSQAKSELFKALALAKHPTVLENLREINQK